MSERLVRVTWDDSGDTNNWDDRKDALRTALERDLCIISIGHFVGEDDNRFVLCRSTNEQNIEGIMIIPKSCIRSIETLSVSRRVHSVES